MKIKLATVLLIAFVSLCVYWYFFAVLVVVDTREMKAEVSELVCSDLNKRWEFGSVQPGKREFRLITLKPGNAIQCNIRVEGYQQQDFVALGYFYHTQKILFLDLYRAVDDEVIVEARINRWDEIKSRPSVYVLKSD